MEFSSYEEKLILQNMRSSQQCSFTSWSPV